MYYNMYICTARCVIVFIWQCDARMCGWRSNTRAQQQPLANKYGGEKKCPSDKEKQTKTGANAKSKGTKRQRKSVDGFCGFCKFMCRH